MAKIISHYQLEYVELGNKGTLKDRFEYYTRLSSYTGERTSNPIKNITSTQENFGNYITNQHPIENKLIAYKTYLNVVGGRILGPFPNIITNFDFIGNFGANDKGIWIPIQRTLIFVVTPENIDKWCGVLDFGFKITNELFINDYVLPEFTSIHYSRLQDMFATFLNYTHASNMDCEAAFKQIRIHHYQWHFFCFDFEGKTFMSTVLEFGTSDAFREFSKCAKSTVLVAIHTHPELYTKKVDLFKGTVSNFPHIIEQHDSWLDSAGANLAIFINGDRTHLTDYMIDDQWLAAFSNDMNMRQH